MPRQHRWNHVNFAVPPQRLGEIEECIDTLFGWHKFVAKPYLLGYQLQDDFHAAALYFRPVEAAADLADAIDRLRAADPGLEASLATLDATHGDWIDHTGFMTSSLEEWEERLAHARRLAAERPELGVQVVDVLRPGDGRSQTEDLYQAFIRLSVLGPWRNTFEMQARG